ncbi:MAG TPA: OmpH family outer membrane protein [Pyrinomonadaceae bacterium]|jgi:Skp family chaperone for outer membrane proteins|nr:OmpH family outer membrane protein [Pyrinomonadaceae bacterium]
MKVFRIIVAAAAFAAFTILAQTQTRPAPTPTTVAIIDSSAFSDEKAGIARVMVAMQQIETKFTPLRTELRGMRERLNTMRSDIQKKRLVQDAKMTAQQTEEADRLEVQIKRKAEDAQSSYQRESLAVLDPLQKEIGTSLVAFAKSKGITLLIDANRVPVVYAADQLDITKDFIADYNRTHPAGAAPAAAPARPTRP